MQTNKKGFIFIEIIVVSIVVISSSLLIYKAFSKIIIKTNNRLYYDDIADIYKTNILTKALIRSDQIVLGDKNNCNIYFNSDCSILFDNLNVDKFLISGEDINSTIEYLNIHPEINIPHSMNNYLKSIKGNSKSLIVSYKKNNKTYYSSLELRG